MVRRWVPARRVRLAGVRAAGRQGDGHAGVELSSWRILSRVLRPASRWS